MQYYFCPRCRFKTVAVKKHLCLTCGYKLPRTPHTTDGATDNSHDVEARHQTSTSRLWSKLFRWEFDSDYNNKQEADENTADPAVSQLNYSG